MAQTTLTTDNSGGDNSNSPNSNNVNSKNKNKDKEDMDDDLGGDDLSMVAGKKGEEKSGDKRPALQRIIDQFESGNINVGEYVSLVKALQPPAAKKARRSRGRGLVRLVFILVFVFCLLGVVVLFCLLLLSFFCFCFHYHLFLTNFLFGLQALLKHSYHLCPWVL